MTRRPKEWNVIVPGRWNPGILTPSGIASRIFKLPKGTPIEIQVLVDDYQFLVKHGPLIVTCGGRLLQVSTEEYSEAVLQQVTEAACAAMENLPETPLLAAGINLKYEILEPELDVVSLLKSGFEDAISDLELRIDGRAVRMTLSEPPGVINLDVAKDENGMIVAFNFHRVSDKVEELTQWLRRPVSQVLEKVEKLFVNVLRVGS